jgi:FkbM family methyltransferase
MEALRLLGGFGIVPRGVIHVGANTGQEFEAYAATNAETVVYIEPIQAVYAALKNKVEGTKGHFTVKALCSAVAGERLNFNVASNQGESSSILELSDHAKLFPDITYVEREEMITTTVDNIVSSRFAERRFDLMVIDVQGAELLVLKGAAETLKKIDAVFTEVSERPLYTGSCVWPEVDNFLGMYDFRLKYMAMNPYYYGNALYLKNSAYFSPLQKVKAIDRPGVNIALNKPAIQSSISEFSRPNDAQGGVNGVIDGSFGFCTQKETRPWWQVDLGESLPLEEVIVFNRLDAGSWRAYPFVLKLGSESGDFREAYSQGGRRCGGADGDPARIKLNGAVARYIRIELPNEEYLHLNEVEVFGVTANRPSARPISGRTP